MRRTTVESVPDQIPRDPRAGKVRYAVAMWLLGLPLPIIIIALFVRGCDW